jgi:MFS family permease
MTDQTDTSVPHNTAAQGKGPFFFQRRFFPMWLGQCLGAVTDNALKQALLIGITYNIITIPFVDNDSAIPFLGALFGIAMALFSPLGGQTADKFETSFMFRRTKLVEVIIMSLASIGFLFRDGVSLTLALFLMGAQSAFFNPSRLSAMPKYLSTKELLPGNAFCNAGLYACIMTGYVIGGGLVETARGPETIGLILVVLAVIGWLSVRFSPKAPADDPELKIDFNWFRQVGKLVGYVKDEPPVWHPMAGILLFYFVSTAITVVLPFYVRDTLGAMGVLSVLIMAIFTIGILIGALSIAAYSKGKSGLGISAVTMTLAAIISVVIYFLSLPELAIDAGQCRGAINTDDCRTVGDFFTSSRAYVLVGLFFLSSLSMGMFIVPLQAAVQRRVQPKYRARIISAGNILNAIAAILGSLSVYFVTETALTPNQAFLGAAAVQAFIGLYMIYRKRSVPEGLYDEMLRENAKIIEEASPQTAI